MAIYSKAAFKSQMCAHMFFCGYKISNTCSVVILQRTGGFLKACHLPRLKSFQESYFQQQHTVEEKQVIFYIRIIIWRSYLLIQVSGVEINTGPIARG